MRTGRGQMFLGGICPLPFVHPVGDPMDFPVVLVDPEGRECLCGSLTSYVDLTARGYHLKPSEPVEPAPKPETVRPFDNAPPPTKPAPEPEVAESEDEEK